MLQFEYCWKGNKRKTFDRKLPLTGLLKCCLAKINIGFYCSTYINFFLAVFHLIQVTGGHATSNYYWANILQGSQHQDNKRNVKRPLICKTTWSQTDPLWLDGKIAVLLSNYVLSCGLLCFVDRNLYHTVKQNDLIKGNTKSTARGPFA